MSLVDCIHPTARPHRGMGAGLVVALGLTLGACSQMPELSLGSSDEKAAAVAEAAHARPAAATDLEKATEYWGKEHAKQPRNGKAALSYARNLKAMDRKPEALAALQASYVYNAQDRDFLSEFGRLALEGGHASLALQLLERADDPARPDWRVLSARGAALAKLGQFKAAVPILERARLLAPTKVGVLNNLAMAYTMDGQADRAEQLLRQAIEAGEKDPRLQQNLAMVLGLQGKPGGAQPGAAVAEAPVVAMPQPAVARVSTSAGVPADSIIRKAIAAEAAKEKATARRISTAATSAR